MSNMELFQIKKFVLLDENCKINIQRFLKSEALVVTIQM